MEALIYIIIFINQLSLKALGDWWYKKRYNKIINHTLSALIDGSIYSVFAYLLFGYHIQLLIGIVIATVGARWLFYDLLYNWINHHKWNHYGNSSWQDKQLKKLGKYHLIPKFILIVLGIILILI